jgi:hypothetical protein
MPILSNLPDVPTSFFPMDRSDMTYLTPIYDPVYDPSDIEAGAPASRVLARKISHLRRLFARGHRRCRHGRPRGPASPGQRPRTAPAVPGGCLHPRRLRSDQQPRRQRRPQDRGPSPMGAASRRTWWATPHTDLAVLRPKRRRSSPGSVIRGAAGRPARRRDRQPVRPMHGHRNAASGAPCAPARGG